ncbi:MAG: sigma-70 family RNA polymerase sigma factor, partial [Gemmataceae bacterium]|nr:sigma-70 family RNA polymerase sigma factor [Gemmataceae bacterium]
MTAALGPLLGRLRAVVRRQGTSEDDAALLSAFVDGRDDSAFEAIVRRHGPMVLGVCRRELGLAHDADDAFQAVFLVLARRAASVDPARLACWLHGVARKAAQEARRAASRRRKRETTMASFPEPAAPMADDWADVRAVLDEEIARLPESQRAAVLLCDLQGV